MTQTKAEPLLYVLRNYSITDGSVKEQYFYGGFRWKRK